MTGSTTTMMLAYLPSPTQSVLHLGPLPIRAYALCIVTGIGLALLMANRRWRAGGGAGAWIGCRRKGIRLAVFADTVIPGVVAAQGIGRWGNWFNNELYGGPTNLPWGLQVHCLDIVTGHAVTNGSADGGQICHGSSTVAGLFQPTFLYESIWDLSLALVLIWVSRRWRLRSGQLFAIYVMGYTAGRGWIEALRDDHANHILGLRLNDWTSLIVFLAGAALFLRRHYTQPDPPSPGSDPASGSEPDEATHPTTIGTT